ncbi:type II toxin-antitoxin system RelE/ParE family toxin [Paenibacillus arenilitoris]|uniref:Type II toxin-antitoxin system RelE/ParE family toxin n=1 Tax=Paenibacillus arenilitoris TaxID=2772299 RepID=A0A927CRM8_9BACL|nr:type II toxin-antitoxin system RelE/ParE family toxin [Paenibacillus arenilitoris]MBD2872499.1 type II toxin-antitoxin system RelE/ParE family toxin [Paenibacillus arenilitoris]
MGNYKIDISAPAENDLRDIVRYISAQLAAPETALGMMQTIEQAILDLEDHPQRYPHVQDERLAMLGYRKLIVKNYIVFYTIDEAFKIVDVERILYTRRNWRNIL